MSDAHPTPDLPLAAQTDALRNCLVQAARRPVSELLAAAEEHLARAEAAYDANPDVDIDAARQIVSRLRVIAKDWDSIPELAKPCCRGMFLYFAEEDDEMSDLASPVGFADDAEVVNACLAFADRGDLCFSPGDSLGSE